MTDKIKLWFASRAAATAWGLLLFVATVAAGASIASCAQIEANATEIAVLKRQKADAEAVSAAILGLQQYIRQCVNSANRGEQCE